MRLKYLIQFDKKSILQINPDGMEEIMIELKHSKAYKLLQDMEDLKLIKMRRKKSSGISELRHKIKLPLDNDQIDSRLKEMRKEWER